MALIFEEPSRALTRNAVIISIGFVPMLFASLVPYIVDGIFLITIMALSWLTTMLLLPAVITLFDRGIARQRRRKSRGPGETMAECGCGKEIGTWLHKQC